MELSHLQFRVARKIYWAIHVTSPLTPWNSNCFPQALTAKILLKQYGVKSTLYIGAAFKSDAKQLGGHAWLRCGEHYITGGDSGDTFGAVISFA